MVYIALTDCGKTISNCNEKALSSDIDRKRKRVSGELVLYISTLIDVSRRIFDEQPKALVKLT